jgi:hypothetical protein
MAAKQAEIRTVLISVFKEDERRIRAELDICQARVDSANVGHSLTPFSISYFDYLDRVACRDYVDDDLREIIGLISVIAIAFEENEPEEWALSA